MFPHIWAFVRIWVCNGVHSSGDYKPESKVHTFHRWAWGLQKIPRRSLASSCMFFSRTVVVLDPHTMFLSGRCPSWCQVGTACFPCRCRPHLLWLRCKGPRWAIACEAPPPSEVAHGHRTRCLDETKGAEEQRRGRCGEERGERGEASNGVKVFWFQWRSVKEETQVRLSLRS